MYKFATRILIGIFTLVILFHLLVIIGYVPSSIVWGGRANSHKELLRLELVSVLVNVLFLIFILILHRTINIQINVKIARLVLWIMGILFLLNTIGNLFSKSNIETMIFTPITLLLSILSFYLAVQYKIKKRLSQK